MANDNTASEKAPKRRRTAWWAEILIAAIVLCSLVVVSSRACASETPSSSTAFHGKVKVQRIAEIDDFLFNPVACYDDSGTLYIAGTKCIWAVRNSEGGHYRITKANWPKTIHLTKLSPPGILSMQWEHGVLIIGTPRYMETDGLGTNYSATEFGTTIFDDGTAIQVKKLGLPANTEILGSQVIVNGSVVAYEPKRDALIRYNDDGIDEQSLVLHATSGLSLSVLGMTDLTDVSLCRNVWLTALANAKISGLDLYNGALYVFNSELRLVDSEPPLPIIKSITENELKRVVWHPSSYGNSVFQVIPVNNKIGLAIWDLNEEKPRYNTIGLGIEGPVFRTAVACNSESDGAILYLKRGKPKLQVYSFTITLPKS